jgi:hypothetical protein
MFTDLGCVSALQCPTYALSERSFRADVNILYSNIFKNKMKPTLALPLVSNICRTASRPVHSAGLASQIVRANFSGIAALSQSGPSSFCCTALSRRYSSAIYLTHTLLLFALSL